MDGAQQRLGACLADGLVLRPRRDGEGEGSSRRAGSAERSPPLPEARTADSAVEMGSAKANFKYLMVYTYRGRDTVEFTRVYLDLPEHRRINHRIFTYN